MIRNPGQRISVRAHNFGQTLNQPFYANGGIIFNAAGSIASTNTFIEADGAGGNLIFNTPTGKNPIFEIAGSTVVKIGVPAYNVQSVTYFYDNQGNVRGGISVQNNSNQIALTDELGNKLFEALSGGLYAFVPFTGFNGINTVGLGLPPIYGSGLLVSIGTTSTTIATYTPTSSTGQNFNVKWVLSAAAATTPTLTVSWTDPKAGAQTVTLFNSAMAANSVQSGVYPLVATSAAAITVSASALVAADIFGTVTISQEQ